MEPRPNGTDRHSQCLGNFLVRQVGPGEQEQGIAIGRGERRETLHQRGHGARGVHASVRSIRLARGTVGLVETRVGTQASLLAAPVMPQQVGRDPEQPGPGIGPIGVVSTTAREGDDERLRREVLGEIDATTTREIRINRGVVAVEDRFERA